MEIETLSNGARCFKGCAKGEFRELVITTGLSAQERTCIGCRTRQLVLMRRADVLGVIPMFGKHSLSVRRTLSQISGVTVDERRQLLEVVGEIEALQAVRESAGARGG